MKDQILAIDLEQIHQLENSRLELNAEETAELMTSLRQHGQLQPIGVRKTEAGYEVVFGNRRVVAAKKLGWTNINALLLEDVDDEKLICLNAIENMQRSDVSFTEQGRLFTKLRDKGLDVPEIAARIGVSRTRVQQCLSSYHHIPVKFREKVSYAGYGPKVPGRITPALAVQIANAATSKRIDQETKEKLFEMATNTTEKTEANMRDITRVVSNGYSIDEAIKVVMETKAVSVVFQIKTEVVAAVEKKTGSSMAKLIKEFVEASNLFTIASEPWQRKRKS